jgi:uncharacterized repeat protein (TIGR03803 family)
MYSKSLVIGAAAGLMAVVSGQGAQAAGKMQILHGFTGGADGGFARAGLVSDASGAFYGATTSGGQYGAGVVFKLTPPASGAAQWTETVLYEFDGGTNGGAVFGSLTLGKNGALYGVAAAGGTGNAGDVFRLSPPAAGKTEWTHKIIYGFAGQPDGYDPWGAVIQDKDGTVYGTTTLGGANGLGMVFKLTPPAKAGQQWTETVLHDFAGKSDGRVPFSGLLQGPGGVLYGTAGGAGGSNGQDEGVVFEMTPPPAGSSQWGFTVLHSFKGGADGAEPMGTLIAGKNGVLYGTTCGGGSGLGTVYALTPPANGATAWTETVLYRIKGMGQDGNGPQSGVTMDASGALYGTTLADGGSTLGEVFKLTAPAAGSPKWGASILYKFHSLPTGVFPFDSVLVGAGGTLYGTTFGAQDQQTGKNYPGTVWSITQN